MVFLVFVEKWMCQGCKTGAQVHNQTSLWQTRGHTSHTPCECLRDVTQAIEWVHVGRLTIHVHRLWVQLELQQSLMGWLVQIPGGEGNGAHQKIENTSTDGRRQTIFCSKQKQSRILKRNWWCWKTTTWLNVTFIKHCWIESLNFAHCASHSQPSIRSPHMQSPTKDSSCQIYSHLFV